VGTGILRRKNKKKTKKLKKIVAQAVMERIFEIECFNSKKTGSNTTKREEKSNGKEREKGVNWGGAQNNQRYPGNHT